MFTELRVQNFKAWRDTGAIRLAPITVFFGANSSGKSSLHQLLLMLKQTAQSPDRKRVLHPGDATTPVDLGTFHDLVFRHDDDATLSFANAWNLPKQIDVTDPNSRRRFSGGTMRFEASVSRAGTRDQLRVDDFRYVLGDPSEDGLAVGMRNTDRGYELTAENYRPVRAPGRVWPLPPPVKFYGFPDEAVVHYQNASFTSVLALALEQQLGRIYYLGPLRESPHRNYVWSGESPEDVGYRGERVIAALLSAQDRQLNFAPKQRLKSFEELTADWLKELGLLSQFSAQPIGRNRKEYEVVVKTPGGLEEVNLTDVGFGVSQVLPVVVEGFYAQPSSTVIFEHPEIHLHPKAQASLADLMIAAVHAREDGVPRGTQVIVESHSEHFLRRLQRRIAEQVLRTDEAALYFCEASAEGASITELSVDLFGNISNWPRHFFGDDMGDLTAMIDAAAKRQST
jgi:predicted ATPase